MADNPANLPNDDVEVLLFETSPYGSLDAIVQHDGRVIYFYLNQQPDGNNPEAATRACWVRNLLPGPYVLNEEEMRQGIAPLLPRTHCKSLQPGQLPRPDDLRIIWFEEGNGAALAERAAADSTKFETLAVIPPWSGMDDFLGYAAECASASPLCWPLPSNPKLQQRIDRAAEFWNRFASPPDPFAALQSQILDAYEAHFRNAGNAATTKYFSIDGGKFPPRGLVQLQTENSQILATVGMSLCPQPAVEMFTEDPKNYRRIELAIELDLDATPEIVEKTTQAISGLAAYPWRQFSWLGNQHTCQFTGVLPGVDKAMLQNDQQLHSDRPINLPAWRDDPINLLWLIPLN